MTNLAKAFLKKGRAGPTYGRHPWVFSSAIERIEGALTDGGELAVYGDRGDFLGHGIFNSKSDIRVRVYSWKEDLPLTKDFFFEKIRNAVDLRKSVLKLNAPESAVRMIFSEGDGLSGLVVDSFSKYLVVQITSLALYQRREIIVEALREFLHPEGIFFRAEKNILKAEGVDAEDCVLFGNIPEEPIQIIENGIKFNVNLRDGQKTGFYADQRDSRLMARGLCAGKTVLDLCTYTGGFLLGALKSGAKQGVGVDASEQAIIRAKENASLNNLENAFFENADVFDFLAAQDTQFDMVVLDPPRFAPSKGSRDKALRAYFRLNVEALRVLAPGGIFATFSCSHQIGRSDFNSMVASAFRKAGRSGRILFQASQGADHPISLACPETQYLKGLFSAVE